MLFSILIAACAIGLIRGGKLSNIAKIKIHYPWLIFSSVMVEFGLLFLMRKTSFITQNMVWGAVFVQYLLLFIFLWFNRQLPYTWLTGLGSLLNFLVIMANKGSMPLSEAAMTMNVNSRNLEHLASGRMLTYHIVNENTLLTFLGDVIYLPAPFKAFLSIGDFVLFAGILLVIQSIIAGRDMA